jgi:hypothetical protein
MPTIPEIILDLALVGLVASIVSLLPTFFYATFGIDISFPWKGANKRKGSARAPEMSPPDSYTFTWKTGERWPTKSRE